MSEEVFVSNLSGLAQRSLCTTGDMAPAPLRELAGETIVRHGWRFSADDIARLPIELERELLWPLVTSSVASGIGPFPSSSSSSSYWTIGEEGSKCWTTLATLAWFRRLTHLDLTPFLRFRSAESSHALWKHLFEAELAPEKLVLDGLHLAKDEIETQCTDRVEDVLGLISDRCTESLRELSLASATLPESVVKQYIAKCSNLRKLNLESTNIGDDNLLALSGLTQLQVLNLKNCSISYRGMAALTHMPLRKLNLVNNTQIYDHCLSATMPYHFGDMRVLMLGLEQAGKTSALYRWKLDEYVTTIPTIGFNVESVETDYANLTIWDVGGSDKLRPLWRHYFSNASCLVWCVDSTESSYTFAESGSVLIQTLEDKDLLPNLPILVLACKQDLPGAAHPDEVEKALNLDRIHHLPCREKTVIKVMGMSAHHADKSPLKWLVQNSVLGFQEEPIRIEPLRVLAPTLTSLSLGGVQGSLTEQGVACLTYLTHLRTFKPHNVTFNDMELFANMASLKKLGLPSCRINFTQFHRLTFLDILDLRDSQPTQADVAPSEEEIFNYFTPLSSLKEVWLDVPEDVKERFPKNIPIRADPKKTHIGPAMRTVMLGLDNSGKTSVLYKLKLGEDVTTIPTIGFNVETLPLPQANINLDVWDVGGQARIRILWQHYVSQDTKAMIWVVDASDRTRLDESRQELHNISTLMDKDTFLLVLANKYDMPKPIPLREIVEALGLAALDRPYIVHRCSALTSKGLNDAMQMLARQLINPPPRKEQQQS